MKKSGFPISSSIIVVVLAGVTDDSVRYCKEIRTRVDRRPTGCIEQLPAKAE